MRKRCKTECTGKVTLDSFRDRKEKDIDEIKIINVKGCVCSVPRARNELHLKAEVYATVRYVTSSLKQSGWQTYTA